MPITFEFTIDDTTPPSYLDAHVGAYSGAIVGGFVRLGSDVFQLSGFTTVQISNDLDIGGLPNLLDQYVVQADVAPGGLVPGLGEPLSVLLILSTFQVAPATLSSVALDQVLPPATAFDFSTFLMNFLDDSFLANVTAGPLPGPATAPEPAPVFLLALALIASAALRATRRTRARGA